MKQENTANIFSKIVAAGAALFLIVLAVELTFFVHGPRVNAGTAGTVGVETYEITALSAVLNGVSPILPDRSFGAHYARYCPSGWTGQISFEAALNINGPAGGFTPLQAATVTASDSQCHTLKLGGYYPNLRLRAANNGAGTVTVYYMAGAAPIDFYSPAVGTEGPTSQIVCDQTGTATVASAATGFLAGPAATVGNTSYFHLCAFSFSFAGAVTAGTITLEFDIDNTCANTPDPAWVINTTANTPQVLAFSGLNVMSYPKDPLIQQYLCLANASGQSLKVNYNYAVIPAVSQ